MTGEEQPPLGHSLQLSLAGLYRTSKNSSGRLDEELLLERGHTPGVETPDTPDVVDALDDGDGLEATIASLLILLQNYQFASHRMARWSMCIYRLGEMRPLLSGFSDAYCDHMAMSPGRS